MKKILLCIVCLSLTTASMAQVAWKYSVKKIAPQIWELHLNVQVAPPWHIYSQNSPDRGPLPTKITIDKNPFLFPIGKFNEIGDRQRKFEQTFNVDVLYYEKDVEFVQLIKIKKPVQTSISGTVEFMVCNENTCLPPDKFKFKIALK